MSSLLIPAPPPPAPPECEGGQSVAGPPELSSAAR